MVHTVDPNTDNAATQDPIARAAVHNTIYNLGYVSGAIRAMKPGGDAWSKWADAVIQEAASLLADGAGRGAASTTDAGDKPGTSE